MSKNRYHFFLTGLLPATAQQLKYVIRRKHSLLAITFLLLSQWAMAALPERKIIITQGHFYYITVDDQTQLATLHEGGVTQRLAAATQRRLPLGRPYAEPALPLAFDISKQRITAINWILHPVNSRYEAIKQLDLTAPQDPAITDEALMEKSLYLPAAAPFQPWYDMLKRNNVLRNNFFDLATPDDHTIIVAMCNQDSLTLSRWDGSTWTHSAPLPVSFEQYFCLLTLKDKIMVLGPGGDLFTFNPAKNELEKSAARQPVPEQHTLVTDKDQGKIYIIENRYLEPGPESLQQLLKKYARELVL